METSQLAYNLPIFLKVFEKPLIRSINCITELYSILLKSIVQKIHK